MSLHNKGWFGRFLFGKGGKMGSPKNVKNCGRQEEDKERRSDMGVCFPDLTRTGGRTNVSRDAMPATPGLRNGVAIALVLGWWER